MKSSFGIKIFAIIAIFGLFAFLIMRTAYKSDTKAGDNPHNDTLTVPTATYKDGEVALDNGGTSVTATDFLQDSSVQPDTYNPGFYTISSPPTYNLTYIKDTGYFTISLLQPPYSTARQAATTQLAKLLEISAADLCKLSYSVTIPGYVDENLSGTDYRFEECPGAVALPK